MPPSRGHLPRTRLATPWTSQVRRRKPLRTARICTKSTSPMLPEPTPLRHAQTSAHPAVQASEAPAVGDLRSALGRSLGSPGGLEMDESPVHADPLEPAPSTRENMPPLHATLDDKSDFPAARPSQDRPAQDAGHAPSESFARTVSHEAPWADDDATDPAWRFSGDALSPRDFVAESTRTNSFPEVPPTHGIPSAHVAAQDTDAFGLRSANGAEQLSVLPDDLVDDEPFLPDYGSAAPHQLGPGDGLGPASPLDDEAKYEEGLPLLSSARSAQEQSAAPPTEPHAQSTTADPFGDVQATDDGDFDSLVNGPSSASHQEPRPLERKSTEQVLGSLQYAPHSETHDDTRASSPRQTSANIPSDDVVDAAKGTVVSQVPDETAPKEQPRDTTAEEGSSRGPKDGDLAELWKAALDDDEFLDDEEPPKDAASLFPDDGEGFLEDLPEPSSSETLNQPSSSITTPVIGQDGKMPGFSSASNASSHGVQPQPSSQGRYTPSNMSQAQTPPNPYAPPANQFSTNAMSARSGAAPGQQFPFPSPSASVYGAPDAPPSTWSSQPSNAASRPDAARAQSYADKSKGGYSSPYDLPMDVSRPKKRASMQHLGRGFNPQVPQPPQPSLPAEEQQHVQPRYPGDRPFGRSSIAANAYRAAVNPVSVVEYATFGGSAGPPPP